MRGCALTLRKRHILVVAPALSARKMRPPLYPRAERVGYGAVRAPARRKAGRGVFRNVYFLSPRAKITPSACARA